MLHAVAGGEGGGEAGVSAAACRADLDERAGAAAGAGGGDHATLGRHKSGYANVSVDTRGRAKPYMAQLKRRGSTDVSLGSFATAEEAALCVARSPEGRAAAAAAKQAEAAAEKRAAAAAAKRAAASEEGQGTSEEVIEVDE